MKVARPSDIIRLSEIIRDLFWASSSSNSPCCLLGWWSKGLRKAGESCCLIQEAAVWGAGHRTCDTDVGLEC